MKKIGLEGLEGKTLDFATEFNSAVEMIEKKSLEITELKSQVEKLEKLEVKSYEAEIGELKTLIDGLEQKSKGQKLEVKTIDQLLIDTKALESLKNRKQTEFEVKAVGTETTGNVVVADTAPKLSVLGVQGQLYQVNRSIEQSILDYVDMGTTAKASIVYVDEVNGEGTVGTTSEGSAKNQIDLDYKEVTVNSEKYTGLVKVTEEALDDVSYMSSEINRVLVEKLHIVESAAIVTAVNAAATTFSLTDFNGTVKDADIVDAIVVATTQSILSGFTPRHIVMNPIDVAAFQLIKSTNIPRFVTVGNRMSVNGLEIVFTTQQTKGTFVLGDLKKYRVRRYKNKLVMGWDADDFSKNLRTIIAESRWVKYVSTNEKTTFVKGTFATIIAAIKTA